MNKRQAEEIFNILDAWDLTELAVEWGLYFERDRWHPWPEEKPTALKRVLTFISAGHEVIGYWSENLDYWFMTEPCAGEKVTHWRELPPVPEGCIE